MNMPGKNEGEPELTVASVVSDAVGKMDRTLDALRRDLNNLRTGRATPSIVEDILVDYYGAPTPLKQLATISAPDSKAILVQPWDKQALRGIERGLIKSEGGFNPSNDGNMITIPIPPLTQERRQEMVKLLKRKIEEGKVSLRNVRRDAVDTLRKMEKDKAISQDEQRRTQDTVQKTTDAHTKIIEEISGTKETEILQV
jgi:ribosome recycling factor